MSGEGSLDLLIKWKLTCATVIPSEGCLPLRACLERPRELGALAAEVNLPADQKRFHIFSRAKETWVEASMTIRLARITYCMDAVQLVWSDGDGV